MTPDEIGARMTGRLARLGESAARAMKEHRRQQAADAVAEGITKALREQERHALQVAARAKGLLWCHRCGRGIEPRHLVSRSSDGAPRLQRIGPDGAHLPLKSPLGKLFQWVRCARPRGLNEVPCDFWIPLYPQIVGETWESGALQYPILRCARGHYSMNVDAANTDCLLCTLQATEEGLVVDAGAGLPDLRRAQPDAAECKSPIDPLPPEVFVDEIDSFAMVRGVDASSVITLDLLEDQVQLWIEQIIGEPVHKNDWGGENCDLFTSRITLRGRRVRAAFLLKGRGTKGELTLEKLGSRGDQLLRLFRLDADLYIVQYVGVIAEAVVDDARGRVRLARSRGMSSAQVCIIDGTDTYRILKGAGKLA